MKLRELINRLEQLSHNGANDDLDVVLKTEEDWQLFPPIKSAWLNQNPDFNFDEENCGPETWVELEIDTDLLF